MSSWNNAQIHRQVHVQELLLLKSVPGVKPRAWNLCLQYVKILKPESKAIKPWAVSDWQEASLMQKPTVPSQLTHCIMCLWLWRLGGAKAQGDAEPWYLSGWPCLSSHCLNQNAESHGLAVSSNQLSSVIKHSLVYNMLTLKTTHTLDVFFPGDEYQNAFQPKRLCFCLR